MQSRCKRATPAMTTLNAANKISKNEPPGEGEQRFVQIKRNFPALAL
jgi:hypothetical protein